MLSSFWSITSSCLGLAARVAVPYGARSYNWETGVPSTSFRQANIGVKCYLTSPLYVHLLLFQVPATHPPISNQRHHPAQSWRGIEGSGVGDGAGELQLPCGTLGLSNQYDRQEDDVEQDPQQQWQQMQAQEQQRQLQEQQWQPQEQQQANRPTRQLGAMGVHGQGPPSVAQVRRLSRVWMI